MIGRVDRTIAEMLADHGLFYTLHPQSNGTRLVAVHGSKGWLGYMRAHAAADLVAMLEDRE